MKVVTLDAREMMVAALSGAMRRISGLKNRRSQNANYDTFCNEAWGDEIESSMAEVALAKYLNQYWRVGAFEQRHSGDVGNGIEARWTRYKNGHLILMPKDADDHVYYLITGRAGTYQIHGFIEGWQGKKQQWWTNECNGQKVRGFAFFVPPAALTPLIELGTVAQPVVDGDDQFLKALEASRLKHETRR